MKHFFILFLIFCFSISFVCGQIYSSKDFGDTKIQSNYGKIIKISPMQFWYGNMPLTGEYGFSVEQKTGLRTSFQGDIAYLGNGLLYLLVYASDTTQTAQQDRITMMGFRVQAAYRIYLGKKFAPEGFYIAPHISLARCRYSDHAALQKGEYSLGTHLDCSLIAGKQFVWRRFVMDISAGITYRQKTWVDKSNQKITAWNQTDIESMYPFFPGNLRPRINFSLGRTF
jgi:hypothetical protein